MSAKVFFGHVLIPDMSGIKKHGCPCPAPWGMQLVATERADAVPPEPLEDALVLAL